MQSMTGYGKGVATAKGMTITVEVKTVNHRYLDWGIKLPKSFMFFEDAAKKLIGSKISRGHIDLFLTYESPSVSSDGFSVDIELAKSFMTAASRLQEAVGIENDLKLSSLLKISEVITRGVADACDMDECEQSALACAALTDALDGLIVMRNCEGISLYNDITAKLATIEAALEIIISLAPVVVEDYRNKLSARIAEVVAVGNIDSARIAAEVALFADHSCIDEEITRLSAHIVNMRKLLDSAEPVGRKLDFLVQELNRETNTIGSKANDLRITAEVLNIKNEIEKIREQTQNIE